jgi:hypothetical protein
MSAEVTLPELTLKPQPLAEGVDVRDQLWELRCKDPYETHDDVVLIHPSQVVLLAERMGILPVIDEDAKHTIARLTRRLRLLADRIDCQHTDLLGVAEKGHECVDEELAYAEASYEIASEFIADLPPVEPSTDVPRDTGVSHAGHTSDSTPTGQLSLGNV